MSTLLRKIAIITGSAAVSVGLLTAVAAPSDAATHMGANHVDSSWGY